MVLTIILVSLFAVSAVSATDNATSVVGVEETALDVVKQTTDDVGSEDQNNNIVRSALKIKIIMKSVQLKEMD